MGTDEAVRVSVAMAVYNGERYLTRQVDSILGQMGECDELILSIDPSNDRSEEIALRYAENDHRVCVIGGPGQGVIQNFEYALGHASGEYIFLSDQDDVWHPKKLDSCLNVLQGQGIYTVVHDAVIVDGDLNELDGSFFHNGFYSGIWRNILRNRYIGCCMAFRRKVLSTALPFPPNIPMHDQWLGIVAKKTGEVAFLNKSLLFYRRHGNTVTGRNKSGLLTKLRWRFGIIMAYLRLGRRLKSKA